MKTRIRYLLIQSLLLLITFNLGAGEYWITADPALTDNTGSGTAASPWVRKTAAGFDSLMNGASIPADSKIHLMAGTFLTLQGVTPKPGWKIVGAGMDATVVKLDVLSAPIINSWPVIGGNGNGVGNFHYYAKDNVEVSDFTVDLNVQNQTFAVISAAVGLAGNNSRISRIKAINWGSTGAGESFLIGIWTHPLNDLKRNAVIDSCIIGPPAQVAHVDGVSAIVISGSPNTGGSPGAGWIEGGEIRNCYVKDVECASSGGVGKPTYFHAFSAAGVGMKIRNNIAINLGPAGLDATGTYVECGSLLDYVVENNTYLDVSMGIYVQGNGGCSTDTTLIRRNILYRNNVITVKSGGQGITFAGYPGGVSGANKPAAISIQDNYIHAVDGATTINGVALADCDQVTVENNTIDPLSGIGVNVLSGVSIGRVENNRKLDGTAASTSGNFLSEEQEFSFTPTAGQVGWYRVIGSVNSSGGQVQIAASYDNAVTDLAFDYTMRGYSTPPVCYGEINLTRYQPFNGGVVHDIRIGTDGGANIYLDIFVGYATSPGPITIKQSGKQAAPLLPTPVYLGNPGTAPAAYKTLHVDLGFVTTENLIAGGNIQSKGTITAGSANTVLTDGTGKILSSALDADLTAIAGLSTATGNLMIGNGSSWSTLGIGTSGKVLVANGTTATWGDALQETAELSSTPVSDTASTSVANTLRLFDFVTLPTTEKLYTITGIEWKNGSAVAGNTICGAVLVDATNPTQAAVPTVAIGQLTANSGANSIQRVSRIASQPIRGGTTLGIFIQSSSASQSYRTATVASANNRKTGITFPTDGNLPNQEAAAWVANTTKAYIKVYYRGYK